ncbi:hypothetical protein MAPG_08697 [Magnaporthiopsis poae ATCC 64411]|uniref:Uncharacterized protein n=1 Tax=Magnaporthiopsis poae (strain ATCC 64411 / 73-15) TaxID=644358 RepID=A0A0C4E811_MAGP6|nr:hypothetical protein MAPG_08697 [Magnaporthiopsis poae ATCC 64411]
MEILLRTLGPDCAESIDTGLRGYVGVVGDGVLKKDGISRQVETPGIQVGVCTFAAIDLSGDCEKSVVRPANIQLLRVSGG